jgi:hypothetical protein
MRNLPALVLIFLFVNNVYGQSDSLKPLKQVFSVSAGISLPMGSYSATEAGGGFAKAGFATNCSYRNNFYKFIEFAASYTFSLNKVDANALSNINRKLIESQVENKVEYTAANGGYWNIHTAMIGLGVKFDIGAKVNFFANVQGGLAIVNSPNSETLVLINQTSYSTKTNSSWNSAPAIGANIGVIYHVGKKTGILLNMNGLQSTIVGNNLEVADIGNNTYKFDTYSFQQKITNLNISLGLSTHF